MRGETYDVLRSNAAPGFQSTLPMRGETPSNAWLLPTAQFQSTLPMRGETSAGAVIPTTTQFQSTLPMRGETRQVIYSCGISGISIHSPHAGRDPEFILVEGLGMEFQSTLPMRGETICHESLIKYKDISIHSPHAGRDEKSAVRKIPDTDFNPLSPCGERQGFSMSFLKQSLFQSTLPMRGETHSVEIRIIE